MQMPVAVNRSTSMDFDCQHITTSDFMQFSVANIFPVVTKQKYQIHHECFSRLEPLPVPTFGRAKIIHRAYFVPNRTIYPGWNDFIDDTPHVYDGGSTFIPSHVPLISNVDLVSMFVSSDYSLQVSSDVAYDFEYGFVNDSGSLDSSNLRYYRFTALGRFAYKMLRSLGYSVAFVTGNNMNQYISAIRLLQVARVYCDFYYPAQYSNTEDSAWLLSKFSDNGDENNSTVIFDSAGLSRLFKVMSKISYGSDYFVSAWDNPDGPNANLNSTIEFNDITSPDSSNPLRIVSRETDNPAPNTLNTPYINLPSTGSALTNYALTALKKLGDFMKRNQIVGSRVIDRYLARYGVVLDADKLTRCYKISEYVQNLQFGDVTSTSDTEGAQLGGFAGKGISYGNGDFEFFSKEYGSIVIITTIIPKIGYFEGMDRHNLHLSRTDFWIPEFDALGSQAIAMQELYTPVNASSYRGVVGYKNKIFGFTPRYAEFKMLPDRITGDYVLGSRNVGKDSWTLARSVKPFFDSVGSLNTSHNLNFVLSNDASQFNRIFYNTTDSADHFNIIHDFSIKTLFPGKSLYDTYEFDDEDKSEKVTVSVGGTTES